MAMSIKERVVKRLFGAEIERQVNLKAAVAVNDNDEAGWRRITGNTTRDLTPVRQERMYQIAHHCWENYPMGKWIIEVLKDFLVADGLPFEAENDDVAQALEDFWYDPLNQFEVYNEKHCREQWLFGVLCLPAFTAENTGYLRTGYIDPAQIKEVVTDPGNVKMVIGVILKDESGQEGLKLQTILPAGAEEVLSKKAQVLRASYTDGECFYSAVNNVTNSPLGRSELLVSADWIDAQEQFLFDYADKWPQQNSFVWDLIVKGSDLNAVDDWAKKFVKKSGDVFAHNENVELKDVTPALQARDANEGNKLFKNHILGAHGYPSFWFGSGEGEQGRALGVEMGTPTFKMLSSKRRAWKAFWELVFQTAIDRRRAARTLICSDEDAKNWNMVLPDLVEKDVTKNSAALAQVTTSLAAAIAQNIIDTVTARKIFIALTATLGISISEEDVEARLKDEMKKRETQDYPPGDSGPKLPLGGGAKEPNGEGREKTP